MKILTLKQEKLIEEAIDSAEVWRGTLTGHPDISVIQEFDDKIAAMKEALEIIKKQQKMLRTLKSITKKNISERLLFTLFTYGKNDIQIDPSYK